MTFKPLFNLYNSLLVWLKGTVADNSPTAKIQEQPEIPDYKEYFIQGTKIIRIVTERLRDGTPQNISYYMPDGHPFPENFNQKRTKLLTLKEYNKDRMIEKEEVYTYDKIDKLTYEYVTKEGVKYQISFEETAARLFTYDCANCARIYELVCLSDADNPCKDYCSNKTLIEIASDFLNQEFVDGFVFKFLNSDGKGHVREYQFKKMIGAKIEGDIESFCNEEHVYHEKEKMCIVIKKDSPNYEESKNDLLHRCDVCKGAKWI